MSLNFFTLRVLCGSSTFDVKWQYFLLRSLESFELNGYPRWSRVPTNWLISSQRMSDQLCAASADFEECGRRVVVKWIFMFCLSEPLSLDWYQSFGRRICSSHQQPRNYCNMLIKARHSMQLRKPSQLLRAPCSTTAEDLFKSCGLSSQIAHFKRSTPEFSSIHVTNGFYH